VHAATLADADTAGAPAAVGGPEAIHHPARATWMVAALAALGVIGLLGAVRLADAFHGDHALFLQYAEGMARGEVLYRDIWDNKQPGIFAFYLVAGSIAGFSEIGVRLSELAYQLVFSAVLVVTVRPWLRTWWLAALAPITTVGAYYATTGTWHLTQAEFVVAFPMYLGLWLAATPWPTTRRRRVALGIAGACAGIVVAFKLVLAPIIVVGWLVSLWTSPDPLSVRSVITERVVPAALGATVVVGALVASFVAAGAWDAFAWATFAYPVVATAEIAMAPWSRLVRSAAWYATAAAPWLVLAAAAGVRWRGRQREWLAVQLVVWIVMGAVAILVQRFSWWEYHFTLFIVPVGLLAIRGADGIIAAVRPDRRRATALVLAIVLVAAPGVATGVRLWTAGVEPVGMLGSAGDDAALLAHHRATSDTYEEVWRDTRFLVEPDALPGPIYVFGDPLYLQLSDRVQAIPTHGWSWEMLVGAQWAALPRELADAAPAYVFLDEDYRELVGDRAPAVPAWLEAAYEPLLTTEAGSWYRRLAP
jgi:hypothetical protein